MAKIRSAAEISKKWVTVTPQRTIEYQNGVKSPQEDWETNTKIAQPSYEQGVQAGIARQAFAKGVDAAGTETWQSKTISVGVPRWGQGVSQAQNSYQEGFSPYRDVIEATTLPPRFPRGDTRNYERVRAIGFALHDKKTGQ